MIVYESTKQLFVEDVVQDMPKENIDISLKVKLNKEEYEILKKLVLI